MNEEELDKYYKIAESVIMRAGKFLRDNFGSFKEVRGKSETQNVTDDDLECNSIYESYLKDKTPAIAIYSEEGERDLDSELVWVIDSIDGTSNYSVGVPLFVTQICLLFKGEPVISFVYAPAFNQLFSAQKGKGAYLNNKKISVSSVSKLDKAVLGLNKGSSSIDDTQSILKTGSLLKTRSARLYGSMGIDLAYMASGKLDALINSGSNLYDYAPGVLLVREAGGIVLNFKGENWTIKDKTLLATNKDLASKISPLIQN